MPAEKDTGEERQEQEAENEQAAGQARGDQAPEPDSVPADEDEAKKYLDQLIRLKAEFENFRKRTDREKPGLIAHGKTELLEKLIPLYDVLLAAHQQVVQHQELSPEGDDPQAEIVKGLEMIFKEFTKLFKGEKVEVIETVGKPYDFDRHEVMGQVATDEFAEGIVVEELQRGYMLDGKVLRPARVRIAKKA